MAKHPAINKAISMLIIFSALLGSIYFFDRKIYQLSGNILFWLNFFFISSIVFLLVSIFIRLTVDRFTGAFAEEIEQKIFLEKFYSFILYSLAAVAIMLNFGLGITNATLFLGLITTGFAFAIREVILSYIIWFMLLVKKPFRIGDYIRVGEEEGKVIHIGTFYALIDNTPDKREDYIRVPNKIFLEKPIQNFGASDMQYNVSIPLKKITPDIEERISKTASI